jgi:hypothetical protein
LNTLRHLYLTGVQLLKQVRALPQTIAQARHAHQRRTALKVDEAERLDRIRNPSKYRGK